jgi:hypothetical protein
MVGVEDLATLEDDDRAVLEAKGAGFDTDPNNNRARRVFGVSYTDHVNAGPVYIHRVQDVVARPSSGDRPWPRRQAFVIARGDFLSHMARGRDDGV